MSKKCRDNAPAVSPESFGFPCAGVDSHAHLDLRHFSRDLNTVLARAKQAGVAWIGNVFLSLDAWKQGQHLFASHPNVFFLLGLHPTDAAQCSPEFLDVLRAALSSDPRLKALGEIGLDYYWKECPPPVQRAAFAAQLRLAGELRMPVVIHSRDAYEETLAVLLDEGFSNRPVLWHCFGGNAAQAERLVAEGWHLSIPGPVSFPANHALREALRHIPLDRLMVETDCPYLAPAPYRGKRNEPAYTVFTVAAMAETLNMSPAELWTSCGNTARAFFGLGNDARAFSP